MDIGSRFVGLGAGLVFLFLLFDCSCHNLSKTMMNIYYSWGPQYLVPLLRGCWLFLLKLSITMNGTPIGGSPFPVFFSPPQPGAASTDMGGSAPNVDGASVAGSLGSRVANLTDGLTVSLQILQEFNVV